MNNCNKTSNNKYFNCPAIMADGRMFTDYSESNYVNNLLRYNNKKMSSNEYRHFLINNATELMRVNNLYNKNKNSCESCNAQEIRNETLCDYNNQYGTCKINDCNGVGLMNTGEEPKKVKNFKNKLQTFELEEPNKILQNDDPLDIIAKPMDKTLQIDMS